MTTTETLKLALEALKRMKGYGNTFAYRSHEQDPHEQVCDAITALEALASEAIEQKSGIKQVIELYDSPDQPAPATPLREHEPVAWMWRCKPYCNWPEWSVSLKRPADSGRDGHKRTEGYEDVPLYTFPPASKPWVNATTWRGLTAEERNTICENAGTWREAMKAIEAKLKEKNCG